MIATINRDGLGSATWSRFASVAAVVVVAAALSPGSPQNAMAANCLGSPTNSLTGANAGQDNANVTVTTCAGNILNGSSAGRNNGNALSVSPTQQAFVMGNTVIGNTSLNNNGNGVATSLFGPATGFADLENNNINGANSGSNNGSSSFGNGNAVMLGNTINEMEPGAETGKRCQEMPAPRSSTMN